MASSDYYAVLGVSRSATQDEIRKAYKKLARENHPDRKPNDPAAAERFKEATEAYEVLSDPDKRQKYDRYGAAYKQAERAGAAGGHPFGGGGPVDLDDLFGEGGIDLGDLFGGGFRSGGRSGHYRYQSPPSTKGPDLRTTIQVPFTVAAEGGQHELAIQREGKTERLTVRIPPGIRDEGTIRLAGQGHPGRHGGPNGDLLVTVRVAPHPYFRREGNHLVLDLPVTITEAALGAKVDVPTLSEGTVTLTIPPGASSGQKLRLRDKGIPDPKTKQKGDQLVVLKIVAPKQLNEESRELLEKFAQANPQDPRAGLW